MSDHDCFKDKVYVIDNMLLCARCFARRAISVHGKDAQFLAGELILMEYKDLSHLETSASCDALEVRKQLYREYSKGTENDSQANRRENSD
jgi:hypothetical protein